MHVGLRCVFISKMQVASLHTELYQVICYRRQVQIRPAPQGAVQEQNCVQDEEL